MRLLSSLCVLGLVLGLGVQAQAPIPYRPDGFQIGGSMSAPIVMDAFIDLLCPDSAAAWPNIQSVTSYYGMNISVALHSFPLPYHNNAFMVAQAALTVATAGGEPVAAAALYSLIAEIMFTEGAQQQFWNAATEGQSFNDIRADLGKLIVGRNIISQSEFDAGMADDNINNDVRVSWKFGCSKGVLGTPSFFVNGVAVNAEPTWTLAQWRVLLDPLLAPQPASFVAAAAVAHPPQHKTAHQQKHEKPRHHELRHQTNKLLTVDHTISSTQDSSVINVESYGAKGDGVTDCTSAVVLASQALMNLADGGTLLFPAGTWLIAGTPSTDVYIDLRNTLNTRNYQIMGAGEGVTTLLWDSTNYALMHLSGAWGGFLSMSISDLTVRALRGTVGNGARAFIMDGDSNSALSVSSVTADATANEIGALVWVTNGRVSIQNVVADGLFTYSVLQVSTPVRFTAVNLTITGDVNGQSSSAVTVMPNSYTQSVSITQSTISGFVNSALRLFCSTQNPFGPALGQCNTNPQLVLQGLNMFNNSYWSIEIHDLSVQLTDSSIACSYPSSETIGVSMFSAMAGVLSGLPTSLFTSSSIKQCGVGVYTTGLNVTLDHMNLINGENGVYLQGTLEFRMTNSVLENNTEQALNSGFDHPTWVLEGNSCRNNGQDFVLEVPCAIAGACQVSNNANCKVVQQS